MQSWSAHTLLKTRVYQETENTFVVIYVNQLIIFTDEMSLLNSVLVFKRIPRSCFHRIFLGEQFT